MSLPIAAGRSLGTARFVQFDENSHPAFKTGDVWLGHGPEGQGVGHQDGRNVLVCAGPRSGKGTSFLVHNQLLWPGSMFVNDPKGENAMVTARARGHGSKYVYGRGQQVCIFDPYNEVHRDDDDFQDLKVRINPLDLLRPDREESILDAARIGDALVIPEEATGDSQDWRLASSEAIADVCLHVASAPWIDRNERNLATVRRLIVEGDQEMAALAAVKGDRDVNAMQMLFEGMIRNDAFGGAVSQAGAMYRQTLRDAPKQLTGMFFSARNALKFVKDEPMQRALAVSDFSLDELKTSEKGMTLYSCMPQRHMNAQSRINRLLTSVILARMEELRFQPRSGFPVLMLLDEFAGLQRMRPIEDAAAQINAHGVKMVFVVQSLAQLKEIYKDGWETLVASCGLKLFFNNEDHFTRDYVSKLVGETEVRRTTRSASQTEGRSTGDSEGHKWSSSKSTTTGYSSSLSSSFQDGKISVSSTSGRSYSETISFSGGGSTNHTHGKSSSSTAGTSEAIHRRNLLNPDEIGRFFGDSDRPLALALASGSQPLIVERTPYYREPMFEGFFEPHSQYAGAPRPLAAIEQERKAAELEAIRIRDEAERNQRFDEELQWWFVDLPMLVFRQAVRVLAWALLSVGGVMLFNLLFGLAWAALAGLLSAMVAGGWLFLKWRDLQW